MVYVLYALLCVLLFTLLHRLQWAHFFCGVDSGPWITDEFEGFGILIQPLLYDRLFWLGRTQCLQIRFLRHHIRLLGYQLGARGF